MYVGTNIVLVICPVSPTYKGPNKRMGAIIQWANAHFCILYVQTRSIFAIYVST